MTVRDLATLEDIVRRDPADRETRLVYADALAERGDPLGELMILADKAADDTQRRRERELRRTVERGLARITTFKRGDAQGRLARFVWRDGVIERVDIDLREPRNAVGRVVKLLERPELRFVRELDLRPGWPQDRSTEQTLAFAFADLVAHLPLRWLGLGSATTVVDDLGLEKFRDKLPALRGIGVLAASGLAALDALAGLGFTDLEFGGPDLTDADYSWIQRAPIATERLVVHHNRAQQPPAIDPIMERFPNLRHLGLMGGYDAFNDGVVRQLVAHPQLARLESLGLSFHRWQDSNAVVLAERAKLARLRLFTAPLLSGSWIDAWHDFGHVYEALDLRAEALAEFDALVTIANTAAHWADVGVQLEHLDRNEESVAAHDIALELDPKLARSLHGRSNALHNLDRIDEALETTNQARRYGHDDIHTWNNRAYELKQLGRHREAIAALDKALERDPGNEWTLSNRPLVLVELGRFDDAYKAHRLVIDRFGATNGSLAARTWARMGIIRMRQGKPTLARRCFETAATQEDAVKDDAYWILATHAALLVDRGEQVEALRIAERLAVLDADEHAHAGWILLALDRPADALAQFELDERRDVHGRALALHAVGRSAEAIESIDQFAREDSCTFNYVATEVVRAAIQRSLGRADDAIGSLRAARVAPIKPKLYFEAIARRHASARRQANSASDDRLPAGDPHSCDLGLCAFQCATLAMAAALFEGKRTEAERRASALTAGMKHPDALEHSMLWEIRQSARHFELSVADSRLLATVLRAAGGFNSFDTLAKRGISHR